MYKQSIYGGFRYWDFLLIDLISMQIAFGAVYAFFLSQAVYSDQLYRNEMFSFMLCQIAVTFFSNPFQDILKRGYYVEFKESFKHVCAVMLIAMLHLFLTKQAVEHPEVLFSLTAAAYFALLYLGRIIRKICLRKGGRSTKGKRSLIVVTVSELAQEVLLRLKDTSYEDFVISGIVFLDKDMTGQQIGDVPVVASMESVKDYVRHEWVDEVFIKVPNTVAYPRELIDSFILMGIIVHLTLSKIENIQEGLQQVELMGGETVLTTSISMRNHETLSR